MCSRCTGIGDIGAGEIRARNDDINAVNQSVEEQLDHTYSTVHGADSVMYGSTQ